MRLKRLLFSKGDLNKSFFRVCEICKPYECSFFLGFQCQARAYACQSWQGDARWYYVALGMAQSSSVCCSLHCYASKGIRCRACSNSRKWVLDKCDGLRRLHHAFLISWLSKIFHFGRRKTWPWCLRRWWPAACTWPHTNSNESDWKIFDVLQALPESLLLALVSNTGRWRAVKSVSKPGCCSDGFLKVLVYWLLNSIFTKCKCNQCFYA